MYMCETCNRRFENPEYNYTTQVDEKTTHIHQSTDNDFSPMEYLNSGTGWISCPECGSDMVIDLSE